jgi:hypothetical protein
MYLCIKYRLHRGHVLRRMVLSKYHSESFLNALIYFLWNLIFMCISDNTIIRALAGVSIYLFSRNISQPRLN